MGIEDGPKQIDQQPELPKVEVPAKPQTDDSEGLASHDHAQENAAREGVQAKIADIRKSLGLETVIASTNQVTNYDEALGQFVLGDNPDKMVSQILKQIPQGLRISDNELGDIHQSIRVWLTESAGNAARHISYRQAEEQSIKYDIQISCKILSKDGRSCLQISMQDNGIGIKPENLDKIGKERFTTS